MLINAIRGSPPRMRGKGVFPYVVLPLLGITPAYAGKSLSKLRRRAGTRDHPRVCGEKAPRHLVQCCILGSPPRMRGKVDGISIATDSEGITPAYAGKSTCPQAGSPNSRDHPRVCGEKLAPAFVRKQPLGSPPRMRGKDQDFQFSKVEQGSPPRMRGKD